LVYFFWNLLSFASNGINPGYAIDCINAKKIGGNGSPSETVDFLVLILWGGKEMKGAG
jgi:hypothetical protein